VQFALELLQIRLAVVLLGLHLLQKLLDRLLCLNAPVLSACEMYTFSAASSRSFQASFENCAALCRCNCKATRPICLSANIHNKNISKPSFPTILPPSVIACLESVKGDWLKRQRSGLNL
jgi:hypothetical protein